MDDNPHNGSSHMRVAELADNPVTGPGPGEAESDAMSLTTTTTTTAAATVTATTNMIVDAPECENVDTGAELKSSQAHESESNPPGACVSQTGSTIMSELDTILVVDDAKSGSASVATLHDDTIHWQQVDCDVDTNVPPPPPLSPSPPPPPPPPTTTTTTTTAATGTQQPLSLHDNDADSDEPEEGQVVIDVIPGTVSDGKLVPVPPPPRATGSTTSTAASSHRPALIKATSAPGWICAVCTYKNVGEYQDYLLCYMCSNARPPVEELDMPQDDNNNNNHYLAEVELDPNAELASDSDSDSDDAPIDWCPCFEERDSCMVKAIKVPLVFVVLPFYIVWYTLKGVWWLLGKCCGALSEAIEMCCEALGRAVNWCCDACRRCWMCILIPLYRYCLLPIFKVIAAFFRGLYRFVLRPIGMVLKATARGIAECIRLLCRMVYIGCLRPIGRGLRWVGDHVLYRLVLRPLWKCCQFSGRMIAAVWRGIGICMKLVWRYTFGAFFRGVWFILKGVYKFCIYPLWKYVLVPIGHCIKGIFQGIWNYILVPIGQCIKGVFQGIWKYVFVPIGKCFAAVFVSIYVYIFTPIGHCIGAVANGIYVGLLTPLGHCISGVARGIWNTLRAIGRGIKRVFS
jgi:hypothetical protein